MMSSSRTFSGEAPGLSGDGVSLIHSYLSPGTATAPVEDPWTNSMGGGRCCLNASMSLRGRKLDESSALDWPFSWWGSGCATASILRAICAGAFARSMRERRARSRMTGRRSTKVGGERLDALNQSAILHVPQMDPLRKDDVRATSENKAPRFTIVLLLPYCSRLHAHFKTGQVTLLNTIGKGYRRRDNGNVCQQCYATIVRVVSKHRR